MKTKGTHIASFNWGVLRADWDDPLIAEFQNNLDRVNAIAERFPGFIWRLSDDEMGQAQIGSDSPIDWANNERVASTLAVWEDIQTLRSFVYGRVHGSFVARGSEWFEDSDWPRLVLWNVDARRKPSMIEAVQKLKLLRDRGSSADAFSFAG